MMSAKCTRKVFFNALKRHRQIYCKTMCSSSHLQFCVLPVEILNRQTPKKFVNSVNYCSSYHCSSTDPQSSKHSTTPSISNADVVLMLKEICDKHKEQGKVFILPWSDIEAMELIVLSFQKLVNEGVYPEFLIDACVQREELFRGFIRHGQQLLETIDVFMACTGLTYENTLRFIANCMEELLSVTPKSIENRLSVFLTRGVVAGPPLLRMLNSHPELLFAGDPQKMHEVLETISNFFPIDEMLAILIACPQITLQSAEALELRYEYIYFHMGFEPEDFRESIRWHELELDEIMMRHEFLRRTGKYNLPDPKRPQLKMENPSIFKIFDTDAHEFATQVAGVRKEEWILFKEIYEKEKAQENMEQPYERIKPSQRKAFERKRMANKAREAELNAAEIGAF